jgi:hypothetical protein
MLKINSQKEEKYYNHKNIKLFFRESVMRADKEIKTDDEIVWNCQFCGEENDVWVDFTVRGKQDFIEDCRICCRPNRIIITQDYDSNFFVEIESY